eukprot:1160984-Pelagomonas_calceolata.AAC.1
MPAKRLRAYRKRGDQAYDGPPMNPNDKILGRVLKADLERGVKSYDGPPMNPNNKILGRILKADLEKGDQSYDGPPMNLNNKILGRVLKADLERGDQSYDGQPMNQADALGAAIAKAQWVHALLPMTHHQASPCTTALIVAANNLADAPHAPVADLIHPRTVALRFPDPHSGE